MDSIEKGLSNEEEAFDKLFDLYNESKNIRRVRFIKDGFFSFKKFNYYSKCIRVN